MFRCPLLFLCVASLVAQKPVTVEGALKVADATNRQSLPVSPISETVALSNQAPAGVAAPAGMTGSWFGVTKIGGKNVAVVVGKANASAERDDTLAIDLDGDGKFADTERMGIEVSEVQGRGGAAGGERAKPVDVTFTVGGGKLAAKASYLRMGAGDPMLNVQFPTYLEAKADIGGAERLIVVLDKNLDGAWDGAEDLWLLARPGDRTASPFALSLIGERRFVDGQLVGIKVAKNHAVQVVTTAAAGPDPKDAAAHRARVEHVWAERFDKERETFVQQRKLDTSRPRADKPVAWNYVSFDEAIALGKKAGKPVFIDVMAFWCVWCYRMDYYTYVDKQVADTLNNEFVPCKIIQEQDLAGDYDRMMKEKLEAQGIPAMGIFDGEGKRLHKIGGWLPPEKFLEELATGRAAFGGK